jgi:4-hydroxy-3-polyprenylbenzoate decarboxylase
MNKIVVAVTGASGAIYSKVLLDKLLGLEEQFKELSVILTKNAEIIWKTELDNEDYKNYPVKFYSEQDFMAPFASGSGQYNTMIIIPCSMGTLGRIANGISNEEADLCCQGYPI